MKRWTMRILICLILGAITTVAVAWGCAWGDATSLLVWDRQNFIDHGEVGWIVEVYEGASRLSIKSVAIGESDRHSELQNHANQYAAEGFPYIPLDEIPSWSRVQGAFAPDAYANTLKYAAVEEARGWPAFALKCTIYDSSVANRHWHGPDTKTVQVPSSTGWRLHTFAEGDGVENGILVWEGYDVADYLNRVSALPLSALALGFLIDTLFYAAIWIGVVLGLSRAHRAIRAMRESKRGRCPRCGYDLRGELDRGCSECGWNREESAA